MYLMYDVRGIGGSNRSQDTSRPTRPLTLSGKRNLAAALLLEWRRQRSDGEVISATVTELAYGKVTDVNSLPLDRRGVTGYDL